MHVGGGGAGTVGVPERAEERGRCIGGVEAERRATQGAASERDSDLVITRSGEDDR